MNKNALFFDSPMPQILIDPYEDRIKEVNHAAATLFWGDSPSLIGQRFSQFFPGMFTKLIAFTQAVIEKKQFWSSDLSIANNLGHSRDLEISASLIEGQLIHLYIQSIQDLDKKRAVATAHKHYLSGLSHWKRVERFFAEVERNNQLILNAAGEGIYGIDANGCTTFVNPVAEQLLGWTAEELVGKQIHGIIHHSHEDGSCHERSSCPIYAAFCDGVVHHVVDDVFWCKDGSAMPVEYTSTPIKDKGYLVGAVVVFRDVSEQRKSQQALMDALNQVEQLKLKLEQENAYLQEEISVNYNHKEIVGKSAVIQQIIQQIELVGPTDATVLITGESGTGKELIARAIHESSQRSQRPLIRVNCAAIPRDLFESEFFGHVKGAFTGAVNHRVGRFELADGGTIFLDEIGELPYELQGKLLRVLQEQQFERLGDTMTKSIDVRVIAATNQDLKEMVEKKEFREDLFFRFNVFPIQSPPLRERTEDIPLLAIHFLEKAKHKFNKPEVTISIAQMNELMAYAWPGNIRELQNLIERQVIVANQRNIMFDELLPGANTNVIEIEQTSPQNHIITEQERRQQEQLDIVKALKMTKGKVFGDQGAANLMGIKPTTLSSRIKKFNIDPKAYKR